jgi:hypothetical protein
MPVITPADQLVETITYFEGKEPNLECWLTEPGGLTQFGAFIHVLQPVWHAVVNADVKLTPVAEVEVTHLGEDGGFEAADADSGASSGDTGVSKAGAWGSSDRAGVGGVAQHGAAVFEGAGSGTVWAARAAGHQARPV